MNCAGTGREPITMYAFDPEPARVQCPVCHHVVGATFHERTRTVRAWYEVDAHEQPASMLLTVPQAAERLHLSRQRVWQLVRDGQLVAQHIGRDWLIEEAAIDTWEPRPVGRPPAAAEHG